jgi:hypothetical protein
MGLSTDVLAYAASLENFSSRASCIPIACHSPLGLSFFFIAKSVPQTLDRAKRRTVNVNACQQQGTPRVGLSWVVTPLLRKGREGMDTRQAL